MTEEDLREVRHYYDVAKRFDLLSKSETVRLFRALGRGDMRARDKIIESNLLLVIRVAQQFFEQYDGRVPLPDLIQEGNVGLIHAVDNFDVDKSRAFAAFAGHLIAQHVQALIDTSMDTVRLPFHLGQTRRAVYRAKMKLRQELGRPPSTEEIADSINASVPQVRTAVNVRLDVVSLETETGDGMTLGSLLPSREPSPVDVTVEVMSREEVRGLMSRLKDRERTVIELAYGLNDNDEYSLRQIGNELGLSYERVRQIKDRAIRLLRTKMSSLVSVAVN